MVIRDNVSGFTSILRREVRFSDIPDDKPVVAEPVFFTPSTAGNLNAWKITERDVGEIATDPIGFVGITFPGKPNHNNEFKQGDSGLLFLVVGNLPEPHDGEHYAPEIEFHVTSVGVEYALQLENIDSTYLPIMRALACVTMVPIGLAQEAEGTLDITISGLPDGQVIETTVPFVITDYSDERALGYLDDPRISRVEE
jgi:hypothetical protein